MKSSIINGRAVSVNLLASGFQAELTGDTLSVSGTLGHCAGKTPEEKGTGADFRARAFESRHSQQKE